MTVIAYRNNVFAWDSGVWLGDTLGGEVKKVVKHHDYIVGATGELTPQDVIEFIENNPEFTKARFKPEKTDGVGFIFSLYSRHAWLLGYNQFPYNIELFEHEYFAVGSGMDIALGAMYAGASAEDAVKAAIYFNDGCKGRVMKYDISLDTRTF